MKKRSEKKKTALGAAILAGALLVTGTFAYSAATQTWKNETLGVTEKNIVLHDDFKDPDKYTDPKEAVNAYMKGVEKSVYAENYGTTPLFVRIKLSEYMEIGDLAGVLPADVPEGETKTAASIVNGATLEDTSTWTTHKPKNTDSIDNDSEPFHQYWSWQWNSKGEKQYMPFLNQPESNHLMNGEKLEGVQDLTEYGSTAPDTQKTLKTEKIITMQKWLDTGKVVGDFWVIDTDGWAYWANPLSGGTATGLLLEGITLDKAPNDNFYYAINVTMEAATQRELNEAWDFDVASTAPSANATLLLNKAAGLEPAVTGVTILGSEKALVLTAGDVKQLEANVEVKNGAPNTVKWTIENKKGTGTVAVDPQTGKLTVGNDMTDTVTLTVKATSTDDPTKAGTLGVTILPAGQSLTIGKDGNQYVNYGDNTFAMIKPDGTLASRIYFGADGLIGTADDSKETISVAADGTKYLGAYSGNFYEKFGASDLVVPGKGTIVTPLNPMKPITDLGNASTSLTKNSSVTTGQRKIDTAKINDNAEWYEIATKTVNGTQYSLIVRSKYIFTSAIFTDQPDGNYIGSNAQKLINEHYASLVAKAGTDNIKNYAAKNDAVSNLGVITDLTKGISSPTGMAGTEMENIMFALSYAEATAYLSTKSYISYDNRTLINTSEEAKANWNALSDKSSYHTGLRSGNAGIVMPIAGIGVIDQYGVVSWGQANASRGIRPAMWVKSTAIIVTP